MILAKLKYYAVLIGGFALAVLAAIARMQTLKNQRDKARQKADILEARAHVRDVEKKEEKKQKDSVLAEEQRIEKAVKEKKLENLDNLTDSNNF